MTSRRAAAAVVVSHPAVSRRARRGGESATARRASTASRASRVGVERIAALTSLSAETLERLDAESLVALFAWSEEEFLANTEGSPIRRIGYECWLRNIAVGLGNAPTTEATLAALHARAEHPSALVREHVEWSLNRHKQIS